MHTFVWMAGGDLVFIHGLGLVVIGVLGFFIDRHAELSRALAGRRWRVEVVPGERSMLECARRERGTEEVAGVEL